jgi:hypothetical protein
VSGLSAELRASSERRDRRSLAQASRIEGMTPAAHGFAGGPAAQEPPDMAVPTAIARQIRSLSDVSRETLERLELIVAGVAKWSQAINLVADSCPGNHLGAACSR